eukprot:9113840-Pyramimonas_sp.AAC.1
MSVLGLPHSRGPSTRNSKQQQVNKKQLAGRSRTVTVETGSCNWDRKLRTSGVQHGGRTRGPADIPKSL